jgi:hypothetical protein
MDLRHKFNKANSYAKACEQVENMEKEFLSLISKIQLGTKQNVLLFYFL